MVILYMQLGWTAQEQHSAAEMSVLVFQALFKNCTYTKIQAVLVMQCLQTQPQVPLQTMDYMSG
uniref:Uncharacterized protein n=1 Tax=uncultured marine virus TaxID=186617 RepID=A0A0F7L8V6_9VIRU|nr:hypothetical protein [uncultured marine virus]